MSTVARLESFISERLHGGAFRRAGDLPDGFIDATSLPLILEEMQITGGLLRADGRNGNGQFGAASARHELSQFAGTLSAAVWRDVDQWIQKNGDVFGLSDTASGRLQPLTPQSIDCEMRRLWGQSIDFPWSRLRSLADKLLKHFVTRMCTGPELEETFHGQYGDRGSEMLAGYGRALSVNGRYWFRRTIADHAATGFHTAISANFKMLGCVPHILIAASKSDQEDRSRKAAALIADRERLLQLLRQAQDVAHYLASCHMELLHATDGIFWDSAGSNPAGDFEIDLSGDLPQICLRVSALERAIGRLLDAAHADQVPEARIGCPALRVRMGESGSLVSAVRVWCSNIFVRFALPLLLSNPDVDRH